MSNDSPSSADRPQSSVIAPEALRVSLLTGGDDRPYVLGLTGALTAEGISVDIVGSDDLAVPELLSSPRVNFLNLRGDQNPGAGPWLKMVRVLTYYGRLIRYAAAAKPKIFHILWNNRFELCDRTILMSYYYLLGRKTVITAHNVNAAERDSRDSVLNRVSLKTQYKLAHHIFVHTAKMKEELSSRFNIRTGKISVIPFGINSTVRDTALSSSEAKQRMGIGADDKTVLFFGQIAPYKGLKYLILAFERLLRNDRKYRLIIAGKPKWSGAYWKEMSELITNTGVGDRLVKRIEHIPDEETEQYFKAADVLILPYTDIFQSGVLFLGYNFGLPAIVTDVGSLKEQIIEGETGFVARPRDADDLMRAMKQYFESSLYGELALRRTSIKTFAEERYSWEEVGRITKGVYAKLLGASGAREGDCEARVR